MSSDAIEAEIKRRLEEEEHRRRLRDLESQINELRRQVEHIETLRSGISRAESELVKLDQEVESAQKALANYAAESKESIDRLAAEGRKELSKLKDEIATARERIARTEGIVETRASGVTVNAGNTTTQNVNDGSVGQIGENQNNG